MKIEETIKELEEIMDLINSYYEFHYDGDAQTNLPREEVGVTIKFDAQIYLRFSSQDLSLSRNGDLQFLLVDWFPESDGFTFSASLKALTPETSAYLEQLPRKEGMPFYGYQERKPFCFADRSLLDYETTSFLKRIFFTLQRYLKS